MKFGKTIDGASKLVTDANNRLVSDAEKSSWNSKSEIPFVVGLQTTTTSAWTGELNTVDALYNGLTIRYWLPRTSSSTSVTLNLTLKGGTSTGAIACYYSGSSRLTTHYPAGTIIILTYVVNQLINGVAYTGWYSDAQYNTTYTTITEAEINAGTSTSTRVITPKLLKYATDKSSPIGHGHTKSEISDFPVLSTVATSGSYNDLSNKPTIPTKTSNLTNDSDFITSSSIPTSLPANGGNADTVDGIHIDSILPPDNKLRQNIGSPSVAEMAIINSQLTDKIRFLPAANITADYTLDGSNWTSWGLTDGQKQALVIGRNAGSITIARNWNKARITFEANGYVYLNYLYFYGSAQGNQLGVKIEKSFDGVTWVEHVPETEKWGSWPGHYFLAHSSIPFHPSGTLGTHYKYVRIILIPNWLHATNGIALYGFEWWGGYPAGSREIYSWDYNKNVSFPAQVTATQFNGNSTSTTALRRRDDASDYSVQTYWTGTYWQLYGYYNGSSPHAGVAVDYADKIDGKHVWVGTEATRGSDANTIYFCY